MKYHILLVLSLLWMMPSLSYAQLDPTLTAMILEYTQKAKSQYNSQLEVMAVETEGHVWLKQEVEATKNYQQQFDRYISTFRGIISYAAQVYGFYYEINHLTENMGRLSHQIGETPVNAIAVISSISPMKKGKAFSVHFIAANCAFSSSIFSSLAFSSADFASISACSSSISFFNASRSKAKDSSS